MEETPWYIQEVQEMSDTGKLRVWCHYNATMLSLKYDFDFLPNEHKYMGLSKPDKKIGAVGIHYYWKNIKPLSYTEFTSDRKLTHLYYGTQKPIEDWYRKFKQEL